MPVAMTAYGRHHLLQSFRIGNFKAVRDSRSIRLKPFNVLIGNNGSGKSSLIEALQTYQSIVLGGLSKGLAEGLSGEDLLNRHSGQKSTRRMDFEFAARLGTTAAKWSMRLEAPQSLAGLEIAAEKVSMHWRQEGEDHCHAMDREGGKDTDSDLSVLAQLQNGDATAGAAQAGLRKELHDYIAGWRFMTLAPERMRMPVPMAAGKKQTSLQNDGSNMAAYLLHIQNDDPDAFNRIVETVQLVMPHIKDIQPSLSQGCRPEACLNVSEGGARMPGWLLSTGTLRLVALVAMLHAPRTPSLIFIDEIENGMDPRAMSILLDEIRSATENGATQVMATTHSPHLLNLLDLSDIIMSERNEKSEPVFWRPAGRKDIVAWAESFSPGQLYTMNRLTRTDA